MHAANATPNPIRARMIRVRRSSKCSRIDMRSMPSSEPANESDTCCAMTTSVCVFESAPGAAEAPTCGSRLFAALLHKKRPAQDEAIVVLHDRHNDTDDQHRDHRQNPPEEDPPREFAI